MRSDKFKLGSGLGFWGDAAEASPHSSLAHLNYGASLAGKGKYEEAIRTYKKGIMVNHYEQMIHNNLAVVYAIKRGYAEAERELIPTIVMLTIIWECFTRTQEG
jgi:Flp pilus assembly protein TadD